MSPPAFSVLIPAAGASSRLGQPKQLIRHGAVSLIQHVIDNALACDPAEIIVVTGCHASGVRQAVKTTPVRWIHNPRWRDGLGVSMAAGAQAIDPGSSAVLILLCDQWRVSVKDLQTLVTTWRSAPNRIVAAQAAGHVTPPVMFPTACFGQLCALEGDQGARGLLKAQPGLVTTVPLENAAFDLDSPTHLEAFKKQIL